MPVITICYSKKSVCKPVPGCQIELLSQNNTDQCSAALIDHALQSFLELSDRFRRQAAELFLHALLCDRVDRLAENMDCQSCSTSPSNPCSRKPRISLEAFSPPISGEISVSIFVWNIWMAFALALSRTPYRPPLRTISGSASCRSPGAGATTP